MMTATMLMLQDAMVEAVGKLEGPYVEYAMTYADHIVTAALEFPLEMEHAVRTQLLYVLTNLDQVGPDNLKAIAAICKKHGFDMDSVVDEMLEDNEDGEDNED